MNREFGDMVYIDSSVKIGKNVKIYPNVIIRGNSVIMDNSVIDSNTIIDNSVIGKNNYIVSSVIDNNNYIGDNNKIGPFSHFRDNNKIGNNNVVGSYVEVSNSVIGDNNKIKHLSYIGNVIIKNNVNIGAGVVFANYHCKKKIKSESIVNDFCCIGANCTIVSPIVIGDSSMIGSGSMVLKNIDPKSLYINRNEEVYKINYYSDEVDVI